MTDKEIILNFKTAYIRNANIYSDYNDSVFKLRDYNEWKKNLLERSKSIRAMYKENERNISLLYTVLSKDLTEETAVMLADTIKEFKENEVHDASIMIDIIDKLLAYFEERKNYDMIIQLSNLGALEEMEFFLRMDNDSKLVNPVKKYKRIIELKDKYPYLKNPIAKRSIFMAYYNLIGPISDIIPHYRDEIIKNFKEVMDFYNSDTVQSIDKDNPDIKEEIHYIKDMFLTGFNYFLKTDKYREEYFNITEKLLEDDDIDVNQREIINLSKDYSRGLISLEVMIDSLFELFYKYYGEDLTYDGTDENLNTYCNCSDIAFVMFDLLKENEFDEDKKYYYLNRVGNSLLRYNFSVPYKDFTNFFDDTSADLFKLLLPFCKTIEQKEDLLTKLVLRRQPITYIHSIMVEKIAVEIAKGLIQKDIFIFSDIMKLGYDTDYKIINYISKAALYHDIGKCLTLGVINLQNRKLTDSEYFYIQLHPEKSKALLENDSSFAEYYDVMVGHHKSYNGLFGYPADFNNVSSPYKSVIDLISIADSIDAATDILGRNYTEGKDFYTLLTELNRFKGTRYNPVMVDYISSDEKLMTYLNELTGEKRVEVYYDVYKKILIEVK